MLEPPFLMAIKSTFLELIIIFLQFSLVKNWTFLSGFIASEDRGEIYGRPVGITEDNIGNILITDDVGGRLLIISRKKED